MKEKLRITSLFKETELTAKTHINGDWRILTEDFFEVSASTFEHDPLWKNKKILKIQFSPQVKYWEMEWDSEDVPLPPFDRKTADGEQIYDYQLLKEAGELNRRKRIAAHEFFAKHNQLQHGTDFNNGFSPSSQPVGIVEIVTQKARLNHLKDRTKAKVFNMIDSMEWQDQYDVALFYAPDLCINKRRSEILHGLIGLKDVGTERAHTGGRMWQPLPGGKGIIADDFLNSYKSNNTAVMKIYIEKARILGVIQSGQGGLYLNGSTFIGRDSSEAVVYFSKDTVSYTNIIQAEVNARGELPEDDMQDQKREVTLKTKSEKETHDAQVSKAWYERYRKLAIEAEELSGKAIPQEYKKLEDLERYIESLKVVKNQEAQHKVSPSGKLAVSAGSLEDMTLEELKSLAKQENVPGSQFFKNKDKIIERIEENRAQLAK